jgi:hypothetical protein
MQTFAFSTAGRIIFGAGTVNRVAGEAACLGRQTLEGVICKAMQEDV